MPWRGPTTGTPATAPDDGYKWVALSNTTAGVFMSALDGSIVIIALVQAVFVVSLGRLGDMLAGPFHAGLVVLFSVAAILSVLGAVASLLRGGRYVPRS